MKKRMNEINGVELNAKQMKELRGGLSNCGKACGATDSNGTYHTGTCKYKSPTAGGCYCTAASSVECA